MKLSELKEILAANRLQLTKSLGQNFLHDANQLRRIVKAAEITGADRVLEIGPGLGHLTVPLAAEAGQVLAVEKDRRLYEWLRQRYAEVANLTLVRDDAVDFLQGQSADWSQWKVVANLPYSVASRLLVDLAQRQDRPRAMVVTVQWEVARRMVAQPGYAEYGLLALLLQLRFEPAGFFKISASCFHPQPEIDSACVKLVRREPFSLTPEQEAVFERIARRSFSQRRKMMLKLLRAEWPDEVLRSAFQALGLAEEARAESISLDQFVSLAKRLGELTRAPR